MSSSSALNTEKAPVASCNDSGLLLTLSLDGGILHELSSYKILWTLGRTKLGDKKGDGFKVSKLPFDLLNKEPLSNLKPI